MNPKIRLEVWAGSIGKAVVRKELDVSTLTAEKQAELQRLTGASGVLQLPEVPAPPTVRDGNQTKIVFELTGKPRTVRIADEAVSPPLRELIDFVVAHGTCMK
jgi:hypothetical protein